LYFVERKRTERNKSKQATSTQVDRWILFCSVPFRKIQIAIGAKTIKIKNSRPKYHTLSTYTSISATLPQAA
jgi:hypothetical protein